MHHSIWTTTTDPAYDDLIAQLAERLGAERFPAHVTVLEAFESEAHDPRFERLVFEPFELTFSAIATTDDPAVVLTADPSDAFEKLGREAANLFEGRVPEPHLSLVYFPNDVEAARALIERSLDLPITISFGRLELWDTKGPLATHPARDWELLSRKGPSRRD